jgi:hypothetical protein
MPKNGTTGCAIGFSAFWPQLRRNGTVNILMKLSG